MRLSNSDISEQLRTGPAMSCFGYAVFALVCKAGIFIAECIYESSNQIKVRKKAKLG